MNRENGSLCGEGCSDRPPRRAGEGALVSLSPLHLTSPSAFVPLCHRYVFVILPPPPPHCTDGTGPGSLFRSRGWSVMQDGP